MSSQLRKHLKFTWRHRLRAFFQRRRLGNLGRNVHLDKNIELLRFPKNISIYDEVVIKEGVRICSCNERAIVKIGNRTTVGYHTFIFSSESIVIGDDCLIAPFVYIVDSNHQIEKDRRINVQSNVTSPIRIGNDVWIASNVTILKGVEIGDGAVIAANSVVNNNVPAYEVWGGTPARKISERL
jgi:acetyltransferase-like isoleucine patch superfamily enzyme